MNIFEALMLVCFGVSWPLSIAKTLRAKVVTGKSPYFIAVVIAGYFFGVVHKLISGADWVIYLYVINLALVSVDLALYFKYRGNTKFSS